MDYSELVKALRHVGICQDCNECEAGRWHNEFDCCLFKDAADAIEDLQAEVKRLKDSNEELREKQTFIDHYGTEWLTSAKDVPTAAYKHGYADGKAEERAKMPKRGEWIDMGDFEQCSVCHGTHLKEFQSYYGKVTWVKSDFCGNCGADMRKMEVQE